MVTHIYRRNILKGIEATGGVGLAGCLGGDGGNGNGGDRNVMVGVLQPTTGNLGDLGGPIRDAAVLPRTQLEGTDIPFTIDIQEEDTQTNPEAGISAAQALVDGGYPAITGAASSGVTIPVAQQVAVPNGVVMCSSASTAPEITDLDDDFLLRTAPSDALQGEVMAQVDAENLGFSSAATFYLNNDYGQQLSDSFVDAFEGLGGSVSAEVAFEAEQPSYTSILQEPLGGGPEVLIVIGYPASGEQIFRDYYADFDGDETIMVTDSLRAGSLPGNVDNPLENVVGTAPLAAGPEEDFFADLFEEEFGSVPGVFTAQAYDATAMLILANVAAGDNDGTAIRDSMRAVANPDGEEVNYQGASSPVDFDDNGDMQTVTYEIFEFADGGIQTTETIEFEAE